MTAQPPGSDAICKTCGQTFSVSDAHDCPGLATRSNHKATPSEAEVEKVARAYRRGYYPNLPDEDMAEDFTPREIAGAKAAIAALEAARPSVTSTDGDAVACRHEPYQGRCAHCDVEFKNGKPVAALKPSAELVEALTGARKWIAPLYKQGEDGIWRAADHALAIIDKALRESNRSIFIEPRE